MLSDSPPSLPEWLYVPEEVASRLLVILDAWDPWPSQRTAENIITVSHYRFGPDNIDESKSGVLRLGTTTKVLRELKQACVGQLQDVTGSKVGWTGLPTRL